MCVYILYIEREREKESKAITELFIEHYRNLMARDEELITEVGRTEAGGETGFDPVRFRPWHDAL